MNKATMERLKNNPHYKLSPKQLAELPEEDREPMVHIGGRQFHDNTKPKNLVPIKREKTKGKKVIE